VADNPRATLLGHKTANILNKMPKSLHTKAKRALQEIWMAETKRDAVKAFEAFVVGLGLGPQAQAAA
jgi:putative transposase